MGRKGGGRAGFMKANRRPGDDGDDSDQDEQPPKTQAAAAPAEPPIAASITDNKTKKEPEAPVISKKASAFLVDAKSDDNDDEENDASDDRTASGESRGQMNQRHKRELKALKEQVKKLGKKGKDEAARLTTELHTRHQDELSQLTSAQTGDADAIATISDTLYGASLSETSNKKQTKAQKRREQRMKEEAERDARIAAEAASYGESERVAEEKELRLLLAPLGLRVKDIPPDGHCLYRSLEDQLSFLDKEMALTTSAGVDSIGDIDFLALRQKAASYIREHADHFRHFVLESDTADGGVADGDDAFESYCSEIESTAAWGGHVEIQALSAVLDVHIQVYSVGMPVLEIGQDIKEKGRPTLRLCYLRHAYGLGEHYNSVVDAKSGEDDGFDDGFGDDEDI